MDIKEFARRLDGREYREEVTSEDREIAKEHGFLIIYGASDDLIEFDGVVTDEIDVGCDGCGTVGIATYQYDGLFRLDSKLVHEKFKIVDDEYEGNGIIIKIGG